MRKLICSTCGEEDVVDHRYEIGALEDCGHCQYGTQKVVEEKTIGAAGATKYTEKRL